MGFDYTNLASGKFELPEGWRVGAVQNVAVVNEQNVQKDYKHEWIEYVDIASVEKGTIKTTQALHINKAPSRARRIVREKDILIATVRPNLEHYVFIKEPKPNTIASTGFAVVTAKQVEPRYLYYYLTTPPFTEYLARIADSHTSAYPAFNPDVIEKAELLIPPYEEQRAIAHILGTLDDRIELNRNMNETLEAMARAIFKSWFIDFDPVKRNMARKAGQNQPSSPNPFSQREKGGHYRGGYDFSGLIDRARELRKKQTPAEAIFWELVRDRRFMGLKFRRQHQLGDYAVDFYCHEHRLVIELDGGVHVPKQKKDHKRDAWMEAQGFKVLRFANEQVLEDPQPVLEQIAAHCIDGASPSGRGGGEGSNPLHMGEGQGEGCVEAFDALFPDSFEDSELGEIPKGWKIKSLDDIADFLNGLACQKYPPEGEESLPVIKIRELRQGITENTDRATPNVPNQYLIHDGDVLFSWSGSLVVTIWCNGEGVLNQHVFKVSSLTYPKWFYYLWTRWHLEEFQRIAADKATTMGHIKRHHLTDAKVLVPSNKLLFTLNKHLEPLIDKQVLNQVEVRMLAKIRDTLLPKLISGEIRVKDAEKFVERTLK